MAPRPYWKGYLKLSLVTCPVSMSPATSESEKVRFHTLNKETGNRVVSQFVDAVTRKPLKDDDEIKGYPRGENDFVLLTDDELDAVALDTVKTIDIDKFVPRNSIEWIYLEKPHYLVPDDPVGHEAFAVIRDAMASDKVLGISKLVIGRRERAVVLEPRGEGIVLWTLRFGDEVRPEESYFEDIDDASDPDLVPLVEIFIKQHTKTWSRTWFPTPCRTLSSTLSRKRRRG
jgi:DNA end-binding protein Ku